MKSGIPIEISGLSKQFGQVTAVDDLSFTVEPGRVTGFLGPNGAGKTTTLRVLLGLVRATAGTATFGGTPYRDLPEAPRDRGGRARRELPPRPHGAEPPEGLRDRGGPAVGAGARGARTGRHRRVRRPARGRLLARHAAAALARVHAARRSRRARARRADQRPRPRGHQVDPRLPAATRARGAHGARELAPVERGAAERRRRRHHLPRPPRAERTTVEPRTRRGTAHDRRLPRSPPARRRTRPGGAGVHRGAQRIHRRRARPRPRRPRGIRRRGGAERPAPTAIRAGGVVPLPRERRGESTRGRRGEPRHVDGGEA